GLTMVLAVLPRPAAAQTYSDDPILVLRQVLDQETSKPYEDREKAVLNVIQRLRRIGDLARALQLQEWKTEVLDAELAAVDTKLRGEVAKRFEKAVSAIFAKKQPVSTWAVIDLLNDMANGERASNTPSSIVHETLATFVPELAQMTSLKNAKDP